MNLEQLLMQSDEKVYGFALALEVAVIASMILRAVWARIRKERY